MFADSCRAWLDGRHPRQGQHSPYSPGKPPVTSVSMKQLRCLKSGGLNPACAVPHLPGLVGRVAVCTSSLSWLPHRVKQVPTDVGGMWWSFWLRVLLAGSERCLKPVLQMLFCSGPYGLRQTLPGAVMESSLAKREQGGEEKENAQNSSNF